jgi:hypothetical protein
MVDNAKLINSVCERRKICKLESKYYNRDLPRKLWDEIALEMEVANK